MLVTKREISRDDILSIDAYAPQRDERRRSMSALKKDRRVSVGPDVTFYFESFDTMLHQVHEMLYIERGGEAQLADELSAYNPLIPNGSELVTTMMIEVEDAGRRARVLAGLGGIEETITLSFEDHTIAASIEYDVDRTTPDGKTSSVHFLRFPFQPAEIERFRTPGTRVTLAINHPNYEHMAMMPERVRAALAGDFA
jgi:Protein of unknown function (DUF3501)